MSSRCRFVWASCAVLSLGCARSAAGAVTFFSDPFGEFAGTGTVTTNSATGASTWYDKASTRSPEGSPFANPPGAQLNYEETWATAKNLTEIIFDPHERPVVLNVTYATSPGGPYSNPLLTSTPLAGMQSLRVTPNLSGVYGIKIAVNNPNPVDYSQMAEVEFHTLAAGTNLALGATQISTVDGGRNGSIHDERYGDPSSWQSNAASSVQFIGLEFGGGQTKAIQFLRIVTGTQYQGYNWLNYEVQIEQGGIWTTVGTRPNVATQSITWVDLGQAYTVEGVRLFGSTANGNNPGGSGIVDDIAFFAPLPEPTTALGVILLAATSLIARGRRV